MSPSPERNVIRVSMPGVPALLLRKGEHGLSVFDPDAVEPPLTEDEILEAFRPGSRVAVLKAEALTERGFEIVAVEGAAVLPDRLRQAHHEIRPGRGMGRGDFKRALRELE